MIIPNTSQNGKCRSRPEHNAVCGLDDASCPGCRYDAESFNAELADTVTETEAESEADTDAETDSEPPLSNKSVSDSVTIEELLEDAMDVVNATDPPAVCKRMSAKYTLLIHLCFVLQGMVTEPFFYLDARSAARCIGVDAMTAWRRLKVLCRCGILELVGKTNRRRSNRYRFIAEQKESSK